MFVTTSFSFRHSTGTVEAVIDRLKALDYAPIADIASTWAYTQWDKAARDAGLKPVFGVQIAVSPNPKAKKPIVDYWTFVTKDEIRAVNELLELATTQFRYQPMLTYQQALEAEGVFIITGHKANLNIIETPRENLFIGLSPACSKGFVRNAISKGFRFCATQNNRYVSPDDKQLWEIAAGRGADRQTYPQWIMDREEWAKHVYPDHAEQALSNLDDILIRCSNVTLPKAEFIKVGGDLRAMCEAGAERIGIDLKNEIYSSRLDTELGIIHEKQFEEYFFVVADLMQWARSNMICGPGRGSSAGSLVCYLLGITTVDPIKHGLLFFRFIDPSRPDWPDIDSDLDPEKRPFVWQYLKDKYGEDRFAKVGALAYFQTKNALNETCKALSIPRFEADKVEAQVAKVAANDDARLTALKEAFENTSAGKAFITKYPEMKVAGDIVGLPTHSSTHAGGIVLASEPLSKFAAIDRHNADTIQIDKDDAEKRGLIKIDLLGLLNLAIFEEALKLAGLSRNYLENIPIDDRAAFDILNDGKFTGTFQFEGRAVRNLTKETRVESLEDIAALSALGRPGPLSSGAAGRWIKRRNGCEEVAYPHELLKPYLENTYGELIYQEQVMLIAHDVAGMDWNAVAKLRKAIGKSQGETAMKEHGQPFIDGLVAAGIPDFAAAAFWRQVVGFGSYSFNYSHAIAYGYVSYWSCHLKAHFPLEFAAASLSFRTKVETQIELLRELAEEGINYTPIDPEHSTDKWRVVNGRLIGPITLIKGLGPKMAKTILSCRARNEELPERAQKLLTNPVTDIDELFPVRSALEKIDLTGYNILSKPTLCKDATPNGDWQEGIVVIGRCRLIIERDENDPKRIEDRKARGQTGEYSGQTKFLEIRLYDDSGEIYAKIGRNEFKALDKRVRGVVKENETLVCVKGVLPPEAPVLLVKNLKVIE